MSQGHDGGGPPLLIDYVPLNQGLQSKYRLGEFEKQSIYKLFPKYGGEKLLFLAQILRSEWLLVNRIKIRESI